MADPSSVSSSPQGNPAAVPLPPAVLQPQTPMRNRVQLLHLSRKEESRQAVANGRPAAISGLGSAGQPPVEQKERATEPARPERPAIVVASASSGRSEVRIAGTVRESEDASEIGYSDI